MKIKTVQPRLEGTEQVYDISLTIPIENLIEKQASLSKEEFERYVGQQFMCGLSSFVSN